jgi:hypothetical protein
MSKTAFNIRLSDYKKKYSPNLHNYHMHFTLDADKYPDACKIIYDLRTKGYDTNKLIGYLLIKYLDNIDKKKVV